MIHNSSTKETLTERVRKHTLGTKAWPFFAETFTYKDTR